MLGVSVGPSKDQLERMKKHIEYEYKMLIHSGTKFLELSQDQTSNVSDKNAYLECFLLHLRVLDEFFRSDKKGNDDDVLASHYSAQKFGALLTDEERENVNKRLAHLTLRRLEGNENDQNKKYNWPVDDFIKKADASWLKFQEIM